MEKKIVNLGYLTPEENNTLKKAQEKAGCESAFVDGVPSMRVLVMALVRSYLNGGLKTK